MGHFDLSNSLRTIFCVRVFARKLIRCAFPVEVESWVMAKRCSVESTQSGSLRDSRQ
jgi:hypothetical protein